MSKIVKRSNKNNNGKRIDKHTDDSMQACLTRVLNGTASLDDLQSVKEEVIDFKQCERKIKTIQLIYNAGSKVGACTIVAGNMYTLKLTERTSEEFKKSLKMLEKRPAHQQYTTVWVDGVNRFTFQFKDGSFYVYYLVTNNEIRELERKITAMDYDSVTLEELQQLQNDLPPFVRAWQESSIDVSKDKDKVFIKGFEDFFKKIETTSTFFKKSLDKITSNLQEIKMQHKAGRMNDMKYVINMPEFDPEKVFPDMLGDINYKVRDAVQDYMNGGLLDLYKMSNKNFYKPFVDACLPYPELALFIYQIFRLTSQAHNEDVKLEKDQYADLRNKIYTKAAVYGVEGAEVVKVAVSVAMRTVKEVKHTDKDGNVEWTIDLGTGNVNNFYSTKVSRIFPLEFEVLRTNQPVYEKLHIIWMQYGKELPEGEEIEFAAGFSADDTIEVQEMFTGTAVNIGKQLMGIVDVYAYQESHSVITIETYDEEATTQNQKTDLGETAMAYFSENKQIVLAGKRSNVLVSTDKKTLVGKVVSSKEFMPNGKPTVRTITNMMHFEPKAGQARIFLLEIQ